MIASMPAPPSALESAVRNNRYTHIRLFVFISLAAIGGLYAWMTLSNSATSGIQLNSDNLGIFSILVLAHAVLFWFSQYLTRSYMIVGYIAVQGALLFGTGLVIHYPALILLLLTSLVGETICVFDRPWLFIVTGLLVYALYGVGANALYGPVSFQYIVTWGFVFWLVTNLPLVAVLALEARSRLQVQRLFNDLDVAHRQLASYAQQIEELTLTAERARMARELHDTLAQGLAGVLLQMEALDAHLERGDSAKALTVTSQIKNRARTTLLDSRKAIDDLRILPEHPNSLLTAIREESERFTATTQVPCTVDLPETLTLPTSTTEHILRFVTEGLSNITRHAHASRVFITVRPETSRVVIEVRDNGAGFDTSQAVGQTGHYGLLGLQERARLAGGRFEIESKIGRGTTLRMYLDRKTGVQT